MEADLINAPTPHYLFAELKNPDKTGVTALVAFALVSTDGDVFYLVIRYTNYEAGVSAGDHLHLSLDEVFDATSSDYGVDPQDWRTLSAAEIAAIDARIR